MLKFLKTKLAPILLAGALAATIVPSAMLALSDNENTAGAATEETAETESTESTAASDITTEEDEGTATADAQIVDDVECTGLIAGKSYTLTGTVHYKEDFTDINGKTHEAGDEIEATLVEAYYGENSLEIEDGKVTFDGWNMAKGGIGDSYGKKS